MTDEPREALSANELHDAITGLERRRAELTRAVETQKAVVKWHREKLALLKGGFFGEGGRRWPFVLLALVLLAGGGLAYFVLTKKPEIQPPEKMAERKLVPRLLVTSVPNGASVTVGGRPVGHTPLLWRAPHAKRLAVEVAADGHERASRSIQVSARAGAHWHAILEPTPQPVPEPAPSTAPPKE